LKNGAKTKVLCFDEELTEAKDTITKNLSGVRVQLKMVSVAVITQIVYAVKINAVGLGIIFLM
jgi:hypothetical protein